jgi:hypothetical protein
VKATKERRKERKTDKNGKLRKNKERKNETKIYNEQER